MLKKQQQSVHILYMGNLEWTVDLICMFCGKPAEAQEALTGTRKKETGRTCTQLHTEQLHVASSLEPRTFLLGGDSENSGTGNPHRLVKSM